MQEHIDTAEVVGGKVNLLTIETLTNIVLAEYLCRFEQQRTRTASRVIHLIDFGLAKSCQTGEEFAHLLWRVILATALTCVARIHTHQVFVGITESINSIVLVVAKVHLLNATKEFHQFLISLDDCCSQLVRIDIKVCKQSLEVILAFSALRTRFNGGKNLLQSLVKVGILIAHFAYITEELAR